MALTDSRTIRVLLIDDHRSVLWGLESLINSQKPKMQVVGKFTSYEEASTQLETLLPDLVLLDLDLGTEQGIDIIPRLLQASSAKILVLTGSRDVALHDNAVIAGAKGVLEKENSAEIILKAIERVHEGQLWVDHDRMERIIVELSRKRSTEENNPERKKDRVSYHPGTAYRNGHDGSCRGDRQRSGQGLHISESTLRNHLSSIYTKLELTNRLELWDYAHKHKLNKPEE